MDEPEDDIDSRWLELRVDGPKISRRTNHSAALMGPTLYVYGGYDVELGILSDFYSLGLGRGAYVWQPVQNPDRHRPGPRRSHTLRTIRDQLYLFGGQVNSTESTNTLQVFSVATGRWQEPEFLPVPPIDSHEALAYGKHQSNAEGKLIIVGGYFSQQASYNDDVYEYNPHRSRLSRLGAHGQKPRGRSNFSAALAGDSLVLFGGFNGANLNDMWSFDLRSLTWTEVLSSSTLWPEPRRGHSMVGWGGFLFLFGGIQNITHERNDLYIFSTARLAW